MYKYRHRGVGKYAAFKSLTCSRKWQLKRHQKYELGAFWDKVIHEYTGGNHIYLPAHPRPSTMMVRLVMSSFSSQSHDAM